VVLLAPAASTIPAELAALQSFENFTLAGIAGRGADGRRKPVWVHAKLMVVDGEWATVGSCNLHRYSLFGNGEMNAAIWDRDTARRLLSELLQEHLGQDTSAMDDRAALRCFRRIARENRTRLAAGDHAWQGLAFILDPTGRPFDMIAADASAFTPHGPALASSVLRRERNAP
jgi:cardiolipin synthase A/B